MAQRTKQLSVLTLIWALLALGSLFVPIRPFLGGGQPFTAFEFIGSIGGALFGALPGAVAAILAKAGGLAIVGGALTTFAILRSFTPAAAVIYLGSRNPLILLVSLVAMLGFIAHPVGSQVPLYAALWLIPIAAWPFRKNLFVRSLGATMTAHALGGLLFIWLVPTTPQLFATLIPIVLAERVVFAAGMTVALLAFERLSVWLTTRVPALTGVLRTGATLRTA